ncbi:MAG: hypothetical protein ACFFER_17120 [Candidatus Thorarchaeota archaeon]
MDDNSQHKITIEVSASGVIIRVENISPSNTVAFDNAYRTARRLLGRIPHINQTIEAELMIEEGRLHTGYLWTQVGEELRLAEIPAEPHERIAMSLLRVYPQFMREVDIVRETGLRQSTVNPHLRGEIKSSQGFFSACDEGHTLTETGINWIITEVIPNLNSND